MFYVAAFSNQLRPRFFAKLKNMWGMPADCQQASQANEWQEWGAKVASWKHLEKLQKQQNQLI